MKNAQNWQPFENTVRQAQEQCAVACRLVYIWSHLATFMRSGDLCGQSNIQGDGWNQTIVIVGMPNEDVM